jgi:hypothetical protein
LEQELKGLQSPGADPSLRNCQSVWEVHRRLEHRQQVQLTHLVFARRTSAKLITPDPQWSLSSDSPGSPSPESPCGTGANDEMSLNNVTHAVFAA